MEVVWLSTFSELEAIEPEYRQFAEKLGDRGLFYEIERLRIVWPAYEKLSGEFAWLIARRGGEIAGIAPLQIERKNLARGLARVLRAFGKVGGAISQWFPDWVIPKDEDIIPVLQAMRAALEGPFAGRWDVLEMEYLQRSDRVTRRMTEVWGPHALQDEPGYSIAIRVGGDFAEYAQRFDKKFIREIQRELRKAEREWGVPRVEATQTLSEADWKHVEGMHRQRQGNVRGRGEARIDLFESSMRAGVFRPWLDAIGAAGRGRHYWIYFGDHLAGFMLGLRRGPSLFLQLTAMDDACAKVSPVRLLMWEILQREAVLGTQWIELGTGANLFKRQFGTDTMELARFHFVNPQRLGSRVRGAYLDAVRKLRALADERRAKKNAPL